MFFVALGEMEVNMGFAQASGVSLHTKLRARGCSLSTTLGSRNTVKSHAQPKDYQGLMCQAVASPPACSAPRGHPLVGHAEGTGQEGQWPQLALWM